jgi:murein L,D-transpeptidase YafK
MEEIYTLSEAALQSGQVRIPVHVFPFRMTAANLAAHADSEWSGFWAELKAGYDEFERTGLPPSVSVCEKRYVTGGAMSARPDGCVENESRANQIARSVGRVRRAALRSRSRRVARRGARRAYALARAERMAKQKRRHAAAYARRPDRYH